MREIFGRRFLLIANRDLTIDKADTFVILASRKAKRLGF